MQIVAEKDTSSRWVAWWEEQPGEFSRSASVLGAVAKLLLTSHGRHVAASDLISNAIACVDGHVEFVVGKPDPGEATT